MRVLERFAAFLPERYLEVLEEQASYARFTGYRRLASASILGGVPLTVAVAFLLPFPLPVRAGAALLGSAGFFALPYLILSLIAERRRKAVEEVLPDALLLISANIESGLTIDKALLVSARDEFGPLADDIRLAAMKMYGGTPVEEALGDMAEATNSDLFEETLKLLIDGIESGGQVSSLLESSADDIRKSLQLRQEIATNVKMYSMFIMIAAVVGAPLLFGISTYLTETTTDLWEGAEVEDVPSTGFSVMGTPNIDVEFFRVFALAALVISNIFAALLISEIKNGNMKEGVKRAPVFVAVSILIFYGSLELVVRFMGM